MSWPRFSVWLRIGRVLLPMANCGDRKSIYGAYEFPKTDGSGLGRVPGNILDWFEISDAQLEIPRLGDDANLVDRHGVESISC